MTNNVGVTLVLGHAASGKSAFAERQAETSSDIRVYLATARAGDGEMAAKIAAHAARRGPGWTTREVPEALADALDDIPPGAAVLLDCATMWLANVTAGDGAWQDAADRWIAAAARCPAPVIVVSNDVGGGIVPANAMARRFQRDQGALNQRLAAAADRVALVTAGLPQWLK